MDELVTLPGVGRKTANVVLGNAFGVPGITVDTHFGRLVRRWGWTELEDPVKVEHAVGELIERKEWTLLSHRVIFHGRRVCHARKPACGVCVLAKDCPSFGIGPTDPLVAAPLVKGPETEHLLALAGLAPRADEQVDPLDHGGRWSSSTVMVEALLSRTTGCGGCRDRRPGGTSLRWPREHRDADTPDRWPDRARRPTCRRARAAPGRRTGAAARHHRGLRRRRRRPSTSHARSPAGGWC